VLLDELRLEGAGTVAGICSSKLPERLRRGLAWISAKGRERPRPSQPGTDSPPEGRWVQGAAVMRPSIAALKGFVSPST
jgi:hypothetical protein